MPRKTAPSAPPPRANPTHDPARVAAFVRGVCNLLPEDPPDADQQMLTAIGCRMTDHDRTQLVTILTRAAGQ